MNDEPINLTDDGINVLSSLLLFTQVFFKLRTGRDFIVPRPEGRESHVITICRELTKVFYGEERRLLINVPPGHYKSTLLSYFVAWSLAHYPDCQFLYISYGKDLATGHTHNIKQIMQLPLYQDLFDVRIRRDSSAKDRFMTIQGGEVSAFGSDGDITGRNAGFSGVDRFSGAVILDDMHKPNEVHSDTMREAIKNGYQRTIEQRVRSPLVPLIGIGQILHESDLFVSLANGFDGHKWRVVKLQALDQHNNVLNPLVISKEELFIKREKSPYVFASQYQQDPIPAGGGIFKPEWFKKMTEEPKILETFLTVDTAETSKTYNDATVFSFWGIYRVNNFGRETDMLALHWIDCEELWCEPKDLKDEFLQFYARCMLHKVSPKKVAIERKSTGVTLSSVLGEYQGIQIINVERTRASGTKTDRYLEIQPYISSHLVSIPERAYHTDLCLEHCRKITANNSHGRDDIADTLYDAVKIGLISRLIISSHADSMQQDIIVQQIADKHARVQALRDKRYDNRERR